jgi:DNA-binding MarR family transcriptional regulator
MNQGAVSTKSARRAPADPPAFDAHLVPYLLSRAYNGFTQAWMQNLRAQGVTMPRWQILAILSEYDGARIGQLAEMSGTAQAVTSRVVDQMERDGLVERRPAPDDRRAVEVWATQHGRATFGELLPEADRVVAQAMASMDAATAQALIDGLLAMIDGLAKNAPSVDRG